MELYFAIGSAALLGFFIGRWFWVSRFQQVIEGQIEELNRLLKFEKDKSIRLKSELLRIQDVYGKHFVLSSVVQIMSKGELVLKGEDMQYADEIIQQLHLRGIKPSDILVSDQSRYFDTIHISLKAKN